MSLATQLHLITPNDELSIRNGSAVLRVASELSSAASILGTVAVIGCGKDKLRDPELGTEVLFQDPERSNKIHAKILDASSKLLVGRTAIPLQIDTTGLSGIRDIFVHNQPWIGRLVKESFPNARSHLYVHNRVLTKATPRTIRERLNDFDSVICVSRYIRDDLYRRSRNRHPQEETNLRLVSNGIDTTAFQYGSAKPKSYDIVYVGRMVPEKGVHILAEAVSRIAKSRPVSVRLIGGKGFLPNSKTTRYERKIMEKLSGPNITLDVTGPVPPRSVPGLVNECRTWVIPSIWQEPFGLVLLEAMASATAPIASNVGGMPEVGADSGVTFVEPGRSRGLADAIVRLLDNPSLIAGLSAVSTKEALKHTWNSSYYNLERAIEWSPQV